MINVGVSLPIALMAVRLEDLPNEVLFQILLWIQPSSVPFLQQVCRKFNDLSQPLLWRHHCLTQFKYWSSEHALSEKVARDAAVVDWKRVFRSRHLSNIAINRTLEDILSRQVYRVAGSEKIIAHGYDAKDTLLRHLNCRSDAEDVLARRSAPLGIANHRPVR